MAEQELIEGVNVKPLKRITDDRGFLMEIFRSDWPEFKKFGQVYMTCCKAGVAKAWHCHAKQTDNFTVVRGKARIALWDSRKDSSTFGKVNEFIISENEPVLLSIPPMVYHGFTAEGNEPAYIVNTPTETYNYENPDELRKPLNDPEIPYDWKVEKGH